MVKREVWIYLQASLLDCVEYKGLYHKAIGLKKNLDCRLVAILMCSEIEVTKVKSVLSCCPFDEIQILVNNSFNELIENSYIEALSMLLEQNRPCLIIGYSSEHTKTVLSQIAYRHNLGMCADCVNFKLIKSKLIATRIAFQGQRYVDIQSTTDDTLICTVIVDTVDDLIESNVQPLIKVVPLDNITIAQESLSLVSISNSKMDIKSNRVVLGMGNGFKRKSDVQKIIFLAQELGIGIGTTKALVEKGWVHSDMQIGMSGRQICADVYIAVGISGAIQHMEGVKKCRTIIAVNNDPTSFIFKYSDIGIVADVHMVLNILEKIYKEGNIC